jgi:hypothetical protein
LAIARKALHRSARISSISLKIGIMRVFSKNQTSVFYLGQKASHKKLQGNQLFEFLPFLKITPFQSAPILKFKQINGRAIFKNVSKFSRVASLVIDKIKSLSRHYKRLGAKIHHIGVVHW